MQEVEKLFSLCVSISPVFFLFLQNLYMVFVHKCMCNLCNCAKDFHFEMNPDNGIFPVLRVKDTISSSSLFLTSEKMLYQSKQNRFVVQHLKTDLTTQIANRQEIQQRALECFFELASRYFRVFCSISFQLSLILENSTLVICPFLPTILQQYHCVSIQGCFNNVFSLLSVKI